jgi:hypothetical protein
LPRARNLASIRPPIGHRASGFDEGVCDAACPRPRDLPGVGPDGAGCRLRRVCRRGFFDAGKDIAKTRQRLICFADGSYIEFLTLADPALRGRHRYADLIELGDGWVDYALVTDHLVRDLGACEAAGLPFDGPHGHARVLADGRSWGVSVAFSGVGFGHPAMPMILQDTEARELRIPLDRTAHPNGAAGILGVTLVARDPKSAAHQMATVLGNGTAIAEAETGAAGVRFSVEGAWVDLVGPGQPQSLAARRLAARGEGLVALSLRCPGAKRPREIAPRGAWSTTHLVPEPARR